MEGWEAWDIALRCAGQLRMTQFVAVGIDINAALKIAKALNYDTTAISELMIACEIGVVTALNERFTSGRDK